jgi:hypothetical protein
LPDDVGIFQWFFPAQKIMINRVKPDLVGYALYKQKFSVKHVYGFLLDSHIQSIIPLF